MALRSRCENNRSQMSDEANPLCNILLTPFPHQFFISIENYYFCRKRCKMKKLYSVSCVKGTFRNGMKFIWPKIFSIFLTSVVLLQFLSYKKGWDIVVKLNKNFPCNFPPLFLKKSDCAHHWKLENKSAKKGSSFHSPTTSATKRMKKKLN